MARGSPGEEADEPRTESSGDRRDRRVDQGGRGGLRRRLPRHLRARRRPSCARSLRDADATFRVVKNTLTERAADEVGRRGAQGAAGGPDRADVRARRRGAGRQGAADFRRETEQLPFKGGLLGGEALDAEQILAIARLPARDVLYGQLVGVVASPITGLVRDAERADRRPRPRSSARSPRRRRAARSRRASRPLRRPSRPLRRRLAAEAAEAEAPAAEAPHELAAGGGSRRGGSRRGGGGRGGAR